MSEPMSHLAPPIHPVKQKSTKGDMSFSCVLMFSEKVRYVKDKVPETPAASRDE